MIARATTLTCLVDLDPVKVEVNVPVRFLGRTQVGQTIEFPVAAFPGRRLKGEIYFISPYVEEATRTAVVKARLPNPKYELKPGMLATLDVTLRVRDDAVVIPEAGLARVLDQDQAVVYLVDSTMTVQPRKVSLGVRTPGQVEILTGLEGGERLIIEGIQKVGPGVKVAVAPASAAAKAVNQRDRLGLPEPPLLLFEFHGSAASVEEQAKTVQEIAAEHGGQGFRWATQPEDRTRLWEARHNAYFACLQLKPGCRSFTTDVCVPISRLADCINETIADLEASFLPAPILGHAGDGNFHCAILAHADDPREVEEAERLNTRIVERALAMDGTSTGEHGVGLRKMDFLRVEHGDDVLDLMVRLKRAFDPLNILNPGKIVAQ